MLNKNNRYICIMEALLLAVIMLLAGSLFTVKTSAEDGVIPVSTINELQAVVDGLNSDGGSATVELTDDVAFTTNSFLTISDGELTILGGGHTLTTTLMLRNDAKVNLGKDGYDKTLDVRSSRSDYGVIGTGEGAGTTAELNIYDGVTIGHCTRIGSAGGITANGLAHIIMHGGTITDCKSASVAGGVYLGQNAVFDMYGGTIEKCTGMNGGAVGLSGGVPFGGSDAGSVTFNMHGGTITDCVDEYIGGGAVGTSFSRGPVNFNMSGGTIKNCSSTGYGFGGAVSVYYSYDEVSFVMSGGTIEDCKAGGSGLGGGICFYFTKTSPDIKFIIDGGTITGCSSDSGSEGYGGAVLLGIPEGSDVQFKSGLIKNNSAKIGGGVMMYAGNAVLSDGFGLHNNTASQLGDDIYNNGAKVTLGTVDTGAKLESCGHKITGWYEDADARWNFSKESGGDDHLELFTNTGQESSVEYGLKAAHGKIYTVIWKHEDGTVLETDEEVPAGATPEYNGETPEKPKDENNTYTFAGWEPEISEVTDDITYTAKFTAVPKPVDPDDPVPPAPPEPAAPTVEPIPDDDTPARPARRARRVAAPAAGPTAPAAAVAPVPDDQDTVIEDDPVPEADPQPQTETEEIEDTEPPAAEQPEGKHWALLNLIAAILAAAGALLALRRRREKDEEADDSSSRRGLMIAKIIGLLAAIAAAIVFILTEDMKLPMVFTDKWTILMLILLLIQIAAAIMAKKYAEEEYEYEEEYE